MRKKVTKIESKTLSLFSRNLARLRKEAGISQSVLAQRAGLTHNFINDLENTKKGFSIMTLDKLAAAVNAEPVQFFVEPGEWSSADTAEFVSILESLGKNFNQMIDYWREVAQGIHKK